MTIAEGWLGAVAGVVRGLPAWCGRRRSVAGRPGERPRVPWRSAPSYARWRVRRRPPHGRALGSRRFPDRSGNGSQVGGILDVGGGRIKRVEPRLGVGCGLLEFLLCSGHGRFLDPPGWSLGAPSACGEPAGGSTGPFGRGKPRPQRGAGKSCQREVVWPMWTNCPLLGRRLGRGCRASEAGGGLAAESRPARGAAVTRSSGPAEGDPIVRRRTPPLPHDSRRRARGAFRCRR